VAGQLVRWGLCSLRAPESGVRLRFRFVGTVWHDEFLQAGSSSPEAQTPVVRVVVKLGYRSAPTAEAEVLHQERPDVRWSWRSWTQGPRVSG